MGRIVHDADAAVLVVGPAFEAALPAIEAEAPGLKRVVRTGEDFQSWIAAASNEDPGRSRRTTTWCCSCTPRAPPVCPRACS